MNLLLIVSTLALAGSLFVEFTFDLPPCKLCLAQRTIYLLLIPFALLRFRKICFGLLTFGILIASYHTLVQMNVLEDQCITGVKVSDIGSYKEHLMKKQAGCADSGMKFLKIPLPAWNGVVSAILLAALFRRRV